MEVVHGEDQEGGARCQSADSPPRSASAYATASGQVIRRPAASSASAISGASCRPANCHVRAWRGDDANERGLWISSCRRSAAPIRRHARTGCPAFAARLAKLSRREATFRRSSIRLRSVSASRYIEPARASSPNSSDDLAKIRQRLIREHRGNATVAKDRDAFFKQGASADQITQGVACLPQVVEGEAERLRIVSAAQQAEPLFEPG